MSYKSTDQPKVLMRVGTKIKIHRTNGAVDMSYSAIPTPLVDYASYSYFTNNVDTAVYGIKTRVAIEVPEVKVNSPVYKEVKARITRAAKRLANRYHDYGHAEFRTYLETHYSGSKRTRYLKAHDSLLDKPLNEKDSHAKCFVKLEIAKKQTGKLFKPRIIQYRSDRYLVANMRWSKSIEELVYNAVKVWNFKDDVDECAKGSNLKTRANCIKRKLSSFALPLVVSLDGSAWDAHITTEALKLEHLFYKTLLKDAGVPISRREEISKYLSWQLNNKVSGLFKDGRIAYTVKGGRMSGDFNTSLGNVILMSAYVSGIMSSLGIPEKSYRMYDDGDDVLVITEEKFRSALADLQTSFLDIGQEIKVESLSSGIILENIEFCSSRLMTVDNIAMLVRHPNKVLVGYGMNARWYNTKEDARFYFRTVGSADLLQNPNCPVMSELYYKFASIDGIQISKTLSEDISKINLYRLQSPLYPGVDVLNKPCVSFSSRKSFERAFGIPPDRQVWMEQFIRDMDLDGFLENLPAKSAIRL